MNIYDIILIIVIVAVLTAAVFLAVRSRKRGGCCGNCSECTSSLRCADKSPGNNDKK